MPHRVALVVNPTAGKGAGRARGAETLRLLTEAGHEVLDVSGTTYAQARAQAEAAVADGVDTVVVVGGDGLVHLGVNLCAGTDTHLAVVAAGTGNDFARNLGLPVGDPVAAVRLVGLDATRRIDLGRMCTPAGDGAWFGGVLGAGFDAIVNDRASRMRWPRGQMRYNLALLRELPVFRPIPYVIELDGERIETKAMLVAVANTTSFGGGMRVCPDADVTDGLFDVLILREISIPAFLRVFPSVYSGTHVNHPAVEIRRARTVRLEATGIRSQADGEPFGALPLAVEVVPRALSVVVPEVTP
ncbi:sphingosine kinase [Intrasporangium oryzae NRRL B-24470]|uniref:Sphingosine kinase n=1 Tax=Intrasporangium oryzae NRRL B-24470 TaxID=1386089 RepID=W9G4C9_9MICO|nr:diacylglycerol kinase [Intrasporangium oryzae]EWT00880.1 sphingosine kinase [Intrasporangium oryzae NRRL B-24470]